MKNIGIFMVAVSAVLIWGTANAASSIAAGKAKAGACVACHGVAGNSANPLWPNLAGQGADYIAKQLLDYKSGARKDPLMAGMTAPLSNEDAVNLGAYFEAMAAKSGVAASKELAKTGGRLYRGGNAKTSVAACMSCHGPAGKGIPPVYPRVSGQHAAYTIKQLKAFKDGSRSNDSKVMQGIAFRMSEAEIKAVSEYMAGLR
ncbi:MAG: c-type cytochrome [Gammaproteobacteria bacterium]|nr:MAG: c-type cytochrome [Gammaproteobacteria bacterium]